MMHKDCEIMMMEQRSDEWFEAHRGVPSASEFSKIVTSSNQNKRSAQWNSYLCHCVDKMLHGYNLDDGFKNQWVEHGTIMEPFARQQYEFEYDTRVDLFGFIVRNGVGCSPDGIGVSQVGLEIKCPSPVRHIETIRRGDVPAEYIPQIQGSMWITGLDQWDYYSYPASDEMKSFCIRVDKDPAYHAALDRYIPMFLEQMHELCDMVRA